MKSIEIIINNLMFIIMKRFLTLLLLVQALIINATNTDVWDGITITPFDTVGGKGLTSENPILIESGAHLAFLAQQVNKLVADGGSDFDGKFFLMTTNIDLDNHEWTPIGWHVTNANNRYFRGKFNGGRHIITNLTIADPDASAYSTCSLFGAVGKGWIMNLGVGEGSSITIGSIVGGIVGTLADKATIQNCYSTATLEGTSYVGGVVGYTTGAPYIINCYNRGDVTLRTTTGAPKKIGGVLGATTTAWMSYCYNTGTVTVNGIDLADGAGGLCGSYYAQRKPVNSYYLEGCAPTNANTIGRMKTESEMKLIAFVDSINADQYPEVWKADLTGTASINDGYPVLVWQLGVPSGIFGPKKEDLLSLTNSPNPVTETTQISFFCPSFERVTIKLFDLQGKHVANIADGVFDIGENSVEFNASKIPAGVYVYKMQIGNTIEANRMIKL